MGNASGNPNKASAHREVMSGPVSQLTRRAWLGITLGGVTTSVVGTALWRRGTFRSAQSAAKPITVYASPSCECCHKWVKHLKDNGFDVRVENVDDVTVQKRKLGVPETLWSCHTATVAGYVIEGHVPADLIQKALSERPNIAGLSAPGMPNGSPGMEGTGKDTYEIVAFTKDGETQTYAVR